MGTYPSPAIGDVPFSSTVAELPLPVALERLFRARATGLLTLEARQGRHVVYLRDGYPVAVELPGSVELLGKVLVEMKILDDATYQATLSSPPPEGRRYGEVLLEKGLLTEEQLRQALKAQVRRKLHRLYFLNDATIAFATAAHAEGQQRNEPLRVHPWRANYHGIRSAWNADRLRGALGPIATRPLHTRLSQEDLSRFGLGPEDGKVGTLLRSGSHTVDILAGQSGLAVQPVMALVYSLLVAAALEEGAVSTPLPSPTPAPPRPSSTAAIEHERLVNERVASIEKEDLFQVLGVERTATPQQIKTAYLDAARRFHPDRLATLGLPHLRGKVETIFSRVSEAQATLLDDKRRADYLASFNKSVASAEDQQAHAQAITILQAELAFKRGQHLLKKNDLAPALRDFEAALTANPDEGEHVVYVAWTRHCMGHLTPAEAKAEINRGLKLQPKCASAHYFLGMLLKEEGADEAALQSFRRAVSLDARQFDAEQEIRVLELRRSKQTEKRGLFDRFRRPK